jgi:hypothetical protein
MQHPALGARIDLVRDDRKIFEFEIVESIAHDRCDAGAHDLKRNVAVAARASERGERRVDVNLAPQERRHIAEFAAHERGLAREHVTKGARPRIEAALRFFPCLFAREEFDENVERVTIGDRAVEVDEDRPVD